MLIFQTLVLGPAHGHSTRIAALTICLVAAASCISPHWASFRVVPHSPNYLLRSPDARETAFPEVLHAYNGFDRARGRMDLRPLMELRIENAYYEKGASRRGLAGFLGTEIARYEITANGLELLSVQSMKNRPQDEPPVEGLISRSQMSFPYYRLYLEVLFHAKNHSHGSVLLGSNSTEELNRLSDQLTDPETVCNATSKNCTVFPDACSVSVEMKIFVNGKSKDVLWGSILADVADQPQHLQLRRLYGRRLTRVKFDPRDPNALRLSLLPGDNISSN